MNDTLLEITNDLFDIASRLKSVKDTYKVFFNTKMQRYEVHDSAQRPSTLAFVVPYDNLDARTVDYARFTAVQNAQKLFAEIEAQNAALEKAERTKSVDRCKTMLEGG